MQGVKTILSFGGGAGYASLWWIAAIHDKRSGFIAIPIMATVLLAVACVVWLAFHWNDK